MISYRLRILFFVASLLFIVHGTEEYLTGFHHSDPMFLFVFAPLLLGDSHQASFVTFQIMLWFLLLISFALLQGKKWVLMLLSLFGVIMILEMHHLFEALRTQSYYSGMFTALLFPIIGFFFWKELLKEWKGNYH